MSFRIMNIPSLAGHIPVAINAREHELLMAMKGLGGFIYRREMDTIQIHTAEIMVKKGLLYKIKDGQFNGFRISALGENQSK